MATRTKTIPAAIFKSTSRTVSAQTVFTDDSGVFTDETADAANATTADVPLFGGANDNLYIGDDVQFSAVWIDMSTNAAGGTRVWEYWNGSTWTTLTKTIITGADLLSADTGAYWTIPSDWATTAVNAVTRYWLRIRTGTAQTTNGVVSIITVAHANQLAGAQVTAYLPETSGRTIVNAWLEINFGTPVLGQNDVFRVEAKFGAAARGTLFEGLTAAQLAAPGETTAFPVLVDCTSEFNTGLSTNASVTVDAWVSALVRGGSSAQHYLNLSAILWVTYDFDDTSSTQVNFAVIPIDSLTGNLATTQSTIGGTGAIPNLDSVLPESTKTYRHWGLVFEGNAQGNGTTDYDFYAQIDSDTEVLLAQKEAANNSGDWSKHIHVPASIPSTSAAHDAKARVTSITGARYPHVAVYLIVVYEFDASAANDRWVSLCLPMRLDPGLGFGSVTGSDKHTNSKKINIQNAGLALQQSGVIMRWNAAGGDPGSLVVNVGAQATRTYTVIGSTVDSGPQCLSHRFDAGAQAGTGGLTLARGENEIKVEWRIDTAGNIVAGNFTATAWLNFTADKETSNRTCWVATLEQEITIATSTRKTFTVARNIQETNYWLDHVAAEIFEIGGSYPTIPNLKIPLGSNLGHFTSLNGNPSGLSSFIAISYTMGVADLDVLFKRHPNDADAARIDFETSRSWNTENRGSRAQVLLHAIRHDYAYTWTADVQNSAGGSVDVDLFRSVTGELHQEGSRTGNGTVAFTVYDDTKLFFAEGWESSTKKGRTNDEDGAGTYTLDLAAPGGGGADTVTGSQLNRGFN